MSSTPLTRNVTAIYRQATAEQRANGHAWYATAHAAAAELALSLPADHQHHGDTTRAAAVLAVLSPQLSWARNLQLARQAYAMASDAHHLPAAFPGTAATEYVAGALGCLKANARKAAALLTTDAPTDEIVSGPKVRAFWWTIADPTDPRAVVVDRHAVDVTLNTVTDDAARGKLLGKRGAYDAVALCYVRAAAILTRETGADVTPAEVQAVTWVVWREIAAPGYGRRAGTDRRRTGGKPSASLG